jgi:hypothetical protein
MDLVREAVEKAGSVPAPAKITGGALAVRYLAKVPDATLPRLAVVTAVLTYLATMTLNVRFYTQAIVTMVCAIAVAAASAALRRA